MLQHVVSLSPVGIVVVDTYRDVVYTNDRARELGLVRGRLLDDRAWLAAQRTLATGEDVRQYGEMHLREYASGKCSDLIWTFVRDTGGAGA